MGWRLVGGWLGGREIAAVAAGVIATATVSAALRAVESTLRFDSLLRVDVTGARISGASELF
jgi:hypothetical protein